MGKPKETESTQVEDTEAVEAAKQVKIAEEKAKADQAELELLRKEKVDREKRDRDEAIAKAEAETAAALEAEKEAEAADQGEIPEGDFNIVWLRPSGREITTNATKASIAQAKSNGWEPVRKAE